MSSPFAFEATLFAIAIVAGVLGAILGLGGGILITPALTLAFGVNIRYAIGASLVSVIATSSGAAAVYVRDRLANIRVAMLLEVATTVGALTGALLSPYVPTRYLFLVFGLILMYSALVMFKRRKAEGQSTKTSDKWAQRLRLASSYPDAKLGEVSYGVEAVPLGFFLMLAAGLLSALLGIGSGILKVPAMDSAMGLPIKVSSATSNFMIGVTGAASAGNYYMRGLIQPLLAAPTALGVLVGSMLGTRVMTKLPSDKIRKLFVVILVLVSIQMILKAVRS